MNQMEYRFQFSPEVDLDEAVGTLRLSLLAAEGPYGEARIRTEVSFAVEPMRAEVRVAGATGVLEAVTQIFTSLLSHEFGRDTFTIRREAGPTAVPAA